MDLTLSECLDQLIERMSRLNRLLRLPLKGGANEGPPENQDRHIRAPLVDQFRLISISAESSLYAIESYKQKAHAVEAENLSSVDRLFQELSIILLRVIRDAVFFTDDSLSFIRFDDREALLYWRQHYLNIKRIWAKDFSVSSDTRNLGFAVHEPAIDPNFGSERRAQARVWFATDRGLANDCKSPDNQKFSDGPGAGVISYGEARISFPASHQVGKIERPNFWKLELVEDAAKHVVISECVTREFELWRSSAIERMRAENSRTALVFVHGFNVTFDQALRRTAQIGFDINFHGLLTCFSWASEASLFGYLSDRESAKLAGIKFASFLTTLRSELGVSQVDVIAHSMGNQVLLDAIGQLNLSDSAPLGEVVLAAPDVDQRFFNEVLAELKPRALRYTIYGSDRDLALRISRWRHSGHRRLGEGGRNLYVADGVETIDASSVNMAVFDARHSYMFDNVPVLSDLEVLVRNSLAADSREGLERKETSERLRFWGFKGFS